MQNDTIDQQALLPEKTLLQMGKYRVERQLASGGFGNTYEVMNVEFEERTGHREAQHDTAHNNNDRRKVDDDSTHDDDSRKHDDDDTHVVRHDEPEVHFLGVDQVQTESGQTWNVGHMVVGSQEVALVDMDDNLVFDVAVTDRNDNGKIEEDEVVDISDRQLSVTDFALASAMQESDNGDTPHPETASNSPQDQIAEDMPDYMSDADVQTV